MERRVSDSDAKDQLEVSICDDLLSLDVETNGGQPGVGRRGPSAEVRYPLHASLFSQSVRASASSLAIGFGSFSEHSSQ